MPESVHPAVEKQSQRRYVQSLWSLLKREEAQKVDVRMVDSSSIFDPYKYYQRMIDKNW